MDSITTDFWDVLVWTFWVFIWITAIVVWFHCIVDLFGDRNLSGWAKAGWTVVLVLLPWLGALIYLVARGPSMGGREWDAVQRQAAQEPYVQQVAGGGGTAEQVSDARSTAASLRGHQPS